MKAAFFVSHQASEGGCSIQLSYGREARVGTRGWGVGYKDFRRFER
ncbi:MAG: hypothetical protein JNL32_16970 [Candidatus Kapabacteria bacterium]|nr:hypothetical protein [Candidatus Kapabacteria bacterium]